MVTKLFWDEQFYFLTFFRISHSLAGKWIFWFCKKPFLMDKTRTVGGTITFERIYRLDWPMVHFFIVKKWRSSSLASHFWPMVLVSSIKDGFYKIEKSIFRTNYARYEKISQIKIIHLKETYKFCFDYFMEKRTVFILIKKNVVKNIKLWFPAKQCKMRKNVKKQNCSSQRNLQF